MLQNVWMDKDAVVYLQHNYFTRVPIHNLQRVFKRIAEGSWGGGDSACGLAVIGLVFWERCRARAVDP